MRTLIAVLAGVFAAGAADLRSFRRAHRFAGRGVPRGQPIAPAGPGAYMVFALPKK